MGHTLEPRGSHATDPFVKAPSANLCRVIAIANNTSRYIGASFYEPYNHDGNENLYLGDRIIDEDELIQLRIDTETNLNIELNNLNE